MASKPGYGGFKAGKFGQELALANNQSYAAAVIAGMMQIPKEATAVLAVNILEAAISKGVTTQDSGRFAANFDLMFDRDSYRDYLMPRYYKDQGGEDKRGIGNRGDKGSHRLAVMMAKRRHYGYKLSKKLGILEFTNGLVANKLGLAEGKPAKGRLGYAKSMPRVELFNPLMAKNQQRKDRWDHKGNTYAFNALGGDGDSLNTYGREVVDIIGKGWLPQRIRELTVELRTSLMNRSLGQK